LGPNLKNIACSAQNSKPCRLDGTSLKSRGVGSSNRAGIGGFYRAGSRRTTY